MQSGRVPNVVNLAAHSPATCVLVVRHKDRPGVLAHVFDRLRDAGINTQETENIIFEGAEAAIARVNLDARPKPELLEAIGKGCADILDLHLVALTA
jgi:D-3-phosphoglycerate dehydrogenase